MNTFLNIKYLTNIGLSRKINEDSLLIGERPINLESFDIERSIDISLTTKTFFVVADGMGGHGKGEIASGIAIQTFLDEDIDIIDETDVNKVIYRAKKNLDNYVLKHPEALNLGTVIAGIYIKDGSAIVFNCGDSRVYKYDGMFCEQLSYDHSQLQQLKDNGIDQLKNINRNVVTSALIGNPSEPDLEIYTKTIALKNNDKYLICSDGLWECMSIEEIENCLSNNELSIQCLYNKVMKAGANDNFSVIVLKVRIDE